MRRSRAVSIAHLIAVFCLGGTWTAPVRAQSTASLVTDPGSTVAVTLGFVAQTDLFGTLNGVDTDVAAADGTALMTLFPTDPPFTHAILHSIHIEVGQLDFHYSFVFGLIQIDVTLTELVLDSTGPANGTIDPSGDVLFPDVPLHMTGTAHIASGILGIDEWMYIDDMVVAPLDAQITEDGGIITLGGIVIPPFQGEVDPADLPDGVSSLVIDVAIDTSNLHFRGPYSPSLPGDGDADGDIDLTDYAAFHNCLAGPGVPIEVYCSLFDYDGDVDVDLVDFVGFEVGFTGE